MILKNKYYKIIQLSSSKSLDRLLLWKDWYEHILNRLFFHSLKYEEKLMTFLWVILFSFLKASSSILSSASLALTLHCEQFLQYRKDEFQMNLFIALFRVVYLWHLVEYNMLKIRQKAILFRVFLSFLEFIWNILHVYVLISFSFIVDSLAWDLLMISLHFPDIEYFMCLFHQTENHLLWIMEQFFIIFYENLCCLESSDWCLSFYRLIHLILVVSWTFQNNSLVYFLVKRKVYDLFFWK